MKFLKISAKLCLMLLASLFAGIFLLWCVFLLPDRLTQTHAARSAETFSYEGIGAAVGYTYADQLDNWTDALMIGNACYQKEDVSALNCVAAAYRPDYQNEDPIFLYPYRVYIPGTGSSGVRVEWNVHGKNGVCVL